MRHDLTELVLIVDRSGSMDTCAEKMQLGMNRLIREQKELPGSVNVTYVQFDDEVSVEFDGLDISRVDRLSLIPRGSTALYDGICKTIDLVGKRLAATNERFRPALVAVYIVTDGGENSSREFTREDALSKIKHQTEVYNWQFSYLGANQDAFGVGNSIGISAVKTANYKTSNASEVFTSSSSMLKNMRSMSFCGNNDYASVGYTKEDHASLEK
jgi:uncharacterized protein YegL